MTPNMGYRKPFSSPSFPILALLLSALGAACSSKPAADGRTFSDAERGFSITRPAGWLFASRDEIREMRSRASFQDKEFESKVRERAVLPFVVIMKHETTYEGLNPSVQVILRPAGELEKLPVLFIVNMLLPSFEQALPDFEIVESPRLETLAGREAAFVETIYDYVCDAGGRFPARCRMWFLRRGKDLVMLSMTDARDGADAAEAEFAEILKSIKIEG